MLTVDRFSPVWTKHGTFPPSFLSVYVISCCLFLRDYVCACLSPPFALHIVFLGVLVTVKSVRPGERNSGKGSHIPKFEENKFELFSMHVLSLSACYFSFLPSLQHTICTYDGRRAWECILPLLVLPLELCWTVQTRIERAWRVARLLRELSDSFNLPLSFLSLSVETSHRLREKCSMSSWMFSSDSLCWSWRRRDDYTTRREGY